MPACGGLGRIGAGHRACMTSLSPRLQRRIERDFSPADAEEVSRLVAGVPHPERVQAAIVLAATGRVQAVHEGVALAALDWRDVLMNGGLGHLGWEDRLDAELGHA